MMEDIIAKQKAFFDAGNTLDTRSRRAMLQILSNTIREVCGEGPVFSAVDAHVQDLRRHLYQWSGTGRLRLLMSLFARPAKEGPVPCGTVLLDGRGATDEQDILVPLVSALAAGDTAVVIVPDSPAGQTVSKVIGETFTDDYVAAVPAGEAPEGSLDSLNPSMVFVCDSGVPCTGRDGFLTFSRIS